MCKAALSTLKPKLTLDSAGFRYPGKRPAASVQEICRDELGVSVADHYSKVVDAEMIEWADHIIYMDGGNKRRLLDQFGDQIDERGKDIHLLADYYQGNKKVTRIQDPAFVPYRSAEFREIFDIIVQCSKNLHRHIIIITGGKK